MKIGPPAAFASSRSVGLLIGGTVFIAIALLRQVGLTDLLELAAYDAYVRNQPAPHAWDTPVMAVTVEEADIQALESWPLTDDLLATVLERIVAGKPRAVGIDIYRDLPVPPGSDRLNALLDATEQVIATYKFADAGFAGVRPPPALDGTTRVGFNDIVVDAGGTVRRGLLFLDSEQGAAFAFALRLAMRYLAEEGIFPRADPTDPQHLRLGETTIPPLESHDGGYVGVDARGYQFLLDFLTLGDAIRSVSLSELLSDSLDPSVFRDRVVLVGTTAQSVPDLFYTPFSRSRSTHQQTQGVILHASITDQLIRFALGRTARVGTASELVEHFVLLICTVAGALVGLRMGSIARALLVNGLGLLAVLMAGYAMFTWRVWIPVTGAALGWSIAAALATAHVAYREARDRRLLMNLFARHVSPELADMVWDQRDKFLRGDRPAWTRLTATILFADVRGFTHVSETLAPQTLTDWIDEYVGAVTPILAREDGVILRFLGDGVMAGFGVPFPRRTEAEVRRDALRAVEAALAIRDRLIELNRTYVDRGVPPVAVRVGIHTGEMVGGTLGDAGHLEYNVHGDSVNTAARLESLDKDSFVPDYERQPCRILISEATLRHVADAIAVESIGVVTLKGKAQQVSVYHVLDRKPSPLPAERAAREASAGPLETPSA